jgi:hypothetical protein
MLSLSKCKICETFDFIEQEVLILRESKQTLKQCKFCWCAFFENPKWLEKSYQRAITDLDTGILQRSDDIANVLTPFIIAKKGNQRGIDFGGGYGLLARRLRDRGFEWQSIDPMVENIFQYQTEPPVQSYGIVSLIEVLEHLVDPLEEMAKLANISEQIYISTLMIEPNFQNPTWWYLQPETGQHIFFLSKKSLKIIAAKMNMYAYTNGSNLHVLSHSKITTRQKWILEHQKIAWGIGFLLGAQRRRNSLARQDYFNNLYKLEKEINS